MGGGVNSMVSTRDAVRSDWASSLSMEALAEDFQVSRAVSLSNTLVMTESKPSNFFARSSMAVDIWASNLVGLRGARAKPPPRHPCQFVPQVYT